MPGFNRLEIEQLFTDYSSLRCFKINEQTTGELKIKPSASAAPLQ